MDVGSGWGDGARALLPAFLEALVGRSQAEPHLQTPRVSAGDQELLERAPEAQAGPGRRQAAQAGP